MDLFSKVLPVRIEDEMKKSYIDYAMSVIVMRALPDVRDGLKPVHRRILYAMQEAGMAPNKPYKKSARIVGEVLGKYHPHGDLSVYDATVRMAQDFSTRYLLVDGHGNFGSVDGDSPAAMRYTEVRMSRVAEMMLADIDKETVNFVSNYDESLKEPSVLPAKIPNLLVNGSAGIAVGMATNIPPHNLVEVIDGVQLMIDNPEVTIEELSQVIKGPDFPTGAQIVGLEGIRSAYHTGRGSVKMRAQAHIEQMSNGKPRIVVTELPYQVNKATLIEHIADLVRNKNIEGITDLRDESDRSGMRVVIELRRDANANVLLNQLYKHTQLQQSFGVIMLALVDGRPRVLNLRQVLYYYIEHQKEIITRRTRYELMKAREREHILAGLKIALDHLDQVIATIRQSSTVDIARSALMSTFSLSEKQAQAILDMRLQRLTGLEREKIEQEYQEILRTIARLEGILADEQQVLMIIKEELTETKRRFGDARRTQIILDEADFALEDLIADEEIAITLTHQGYIKRILLDTYRSQKRGGKGVTGMHTKEEDFVENLFVSTTHHTILFFTSRGRVYRLKGYEIPEHSRQSKGTNIVNLLPLEGQEKVTAVIQVDRFDGEKFMFMATKMGIVKKTPLQEFGSLRKGGLIALTLADDDDLVEVRLTNGRQQVLMGTRQGMLIRFSETDVRSMGRLARGVHGIRLKEDDYVIGVETVSQDVETELLVVTANGYGKRTLVSEYRLTNRGGKGVRLIGLSEKNGQVAGMKGIDGENHDIMLLTSGGMIIRMDANTVSQQGRGAQGVTLIKTDESDGVVSVARLAKRDAEDAVE